MALEAKSRRLIELHVSGSGAKHLIDAFVEELPPLPAIRQSLLRELPRHSNIRIDEMVFYVECDDRDSAYNTLSLYETMYPEIEFVLVGHANADQTKRR